MRCIGLSVSAPVRPTAERNRGGLAAVADSGRLDIGVEIGLQAIGWQVARADHGPSQRDQRCRGRNRGGGPKEQATAPEEASTAVNQMDQVTQQNAAMVEQSTAASHSLSQETEQLSGLIGRFQVGRPSDDDSIRQDLQKVAPHAFQQPAKRAVASGARRGA